MKGKNLFCPVGLLALCLGSAAAPPVIFESATLGPTGDIAGYSVHAECLSGARFSVTNTVVVVAVGSHLNRYHGNSVFAAIVSLDYYYTQTRLPLGSPLRPEEVLASGVFALNEPLSSDYVFPLSVCLAPGNYAVIFGKGWLGDAREPEPVIMTLGNEDLPGVRPYIQWNGSIWEESRTTNVRMVVYGSPLPTLKIHRAQTGGVILSWPALLTNFVLQTCDQLSPTNEWITMPNNSSSLLGDQWVISNRTDKISQYFRLKKE
jgi:hypothetical protein